MSTASGVRPEQHTRVCVRPATLASGFRRLRPTEVFAEPFGVIALSHFAAGLMNVYVAEPARRDEVRELSSTRSFAARRVAQVAPSRLADRRPVDASVRLDDHNLYFSHLALILGVRRLVACDGAPRNWQLRGRRTRRRAPAHGSSTISERGRSRSPLHHAPSYPDSDMWPAGSIRHAPRVSTLRPGIRHPCPREPLAGYLATMEEHTDAGTQLFHSAVIDPTTPSLVAPRRTRRRRVAARRAGRNSTSRRSRPTSHVHNTHITART